MKLVRIDDLSEEEKRKLEEELYGDKSNQTPSVPIQTSERNKDADNRSFIGDFLGGLGFATGVSSKVINDLRNNQEFQSKAQERGLDLNQIYTPQENINMFSKDVERTMESLGQGLKSSGSNLGKGTLLFGRDLGIASDVADKITNEMRNRSDNELEEIAKKSNISTQTLKDFVNSTKTSYENINDFSANTFDKWANEANQRIGELQGETQNEFAKKAIGFMPNLSQQAITMGASLINPVLGTYVASGQAKGSYFNDAKERGMTDEQANNYSSVMAGVEGVTEMLSINNMIKAGKGAKALTKGGIKGAIGELTKKELVDDTIKGTLKSYGKGVLENALQEAITEPIQEAVADMTAGKGNWENIGQRMIEAGINGAISSAITGGVNMGIQSCVEATKPGATPEQILEAYVDVMAESKNWTDAQKQQFLESAKNSSEAELQAMKSRIEAENARKARENEQNITQNEQENIEPTQTAENAQIGENTEEQQIIQQENENALKENVEAQNQEQTQENQAQEKNVQENLTEEEKLQKTQEKLTSEQEEAQVEESTKEKQFKIIQENNPKDKNLSDHTWIENKDDIKTYQEAVDSDNATTPDFTEEDMQKALDTGKVTVYSSTPIEQGAFVSPSKMEAQSYAGNGEIYSKEINTSDVAWIDPLQGQYAQLEQQETPNQNTQENLQSENKTENVQEKLTKKYGEETAQKLLNNFSPEEINNITNINEELNNKNQNDIMTEEEQTTEPLRVSPEQAPKQTNNKLLSQDTLKEAMNELTPEKKAETLAKIMNKLPEQRTEKESVLLSLLTKLVDRNAVFENLALKTHNRQLQATADTLMLSQARAQYAIGNERTLSNGQKVKSLDSIIAEVGQNAPQFYEYMYHWLNTDRMSLVERGFGQENKPVFGEDMTAEKSREIIKQIEKEHPEFKKYAEDVYTYNDRNIEELVSHGVISQDLAKVWKEMYPHYVPISRADVQNNAISVPLDTNRTGINAPIQRAKGGSGDIQPLFETMANRTEQVYRASDRNLFGLELRKSMKKANMLNEAVEGSSVEAILDGMQDLNDNAGINEVKGQNPTFTVFENGNKVTYEISPDMLSALKPRDQQGFMSKFDNSKFSKVLRGISNFRRNFLTEYNPVFALTNAIKDAQDVLYNSQHAKSTYKNFPEAYAQIVQKGHWYKEYLEAGGEQNSYYKDGQFENFNQDKSKKNVPTWKKAVKFPFEKIAQMNNIIETAPRLAEYIASREQGKSIQESMLDASRVTTNFKAGGDVTKFLNRNGATFLNASVQGLAQNVRNIREANQKGIKGYATLLAKTVVAGTPALILNGLVWDDDEDYEELSDYVKENNYVIGKIGDKFITIPKGRVVAVVQDMVTNVQDYMTGKKELDGEKIAKDLLGTKDLAIANLAPNNPLENNIFSPIVNVATNKTWYGSDLVPTRLQDEKPENQIKEDTDAFSTWLGQTMGWSPIKINYLLDQYGGGLSDILLPHITPQAEENDFFTDKFVKDATMKNGNPGKFYEMRDSLDKSKTASEEDKVKAKYVEKVNSELNDLYKQQREIQMSPNTDEYKKEAVKNIRSKINELSKNALKEVENFDKKSVPMSTDKSSSTSSSTGSVPMSEVKTIGDYTYYKDSDGNWKSVSKTDMQKNENAGISNETYARYKEETQGLTTTEDKITALQDGNYTKAEKSAIYENYISKSDKTYKALKEAGVNIDTYLDYKLNYNGTTKDEFYEYINSAKMSYPQKLLLTATKYKLQYEDEKDYLVNYINKLKISADEKKKIFRQLKGATITSDGQLSY